MKKHVVSCYDCGCQFDANRGGAYLKSAHRYVCKKCARKRGHGHSPMWWYFIGWWWVPIYWLMIGWWWRPLRWFVRGY